MADDLRHWIFERYLPQNLKARDPRTREHYGHALNDLGRFLGREPTLADLSDETFAAFLVHLLDERRLAETTANERMKRIRSFWNWAARKRHVDQFPTISCVPVPERLPVAWRENELVKIVNACRGERGMVGDVPMWRFMVTLHGWLWNTSERIGATFLMAPDHLRLDEAIAALPAGIRKGKRRARVYRLWPDLVEMFRSMLPPSTKDRRRVFDWDEHFDRTTFYKRYDRMLIRAGLPHDRYRKPHAMRVSHASWLHISGGDATRSLGHSDPATTRRYIDPTLDAQDESKLFRPW